MFKGRQRIEEFRFTDPLAIVIRNYSSRTRTNIMGHNSSEQISTGTNFIRTYTF